ncbi:hypothetical protein THARTR1_01646 [Trichoderma harzianum]|uniref:Uncharacterized protein n=1 Tax=Trichoderma harzianum TaxID=5544 RepID=A0A2K0ULG5_TRIHA|nr:hypothetical protein THARTR1_01646 [Trichoderma harzianum]
MEAFLEEFLKRAIAPLIADIASMKKDIASMKEDIASMKEDILVLPQRSYLMERRANDDNGVSAAGDAGGVPDTDDNAVASVDDDRKYDDINTELADIFRISYADN